MASDKKNSKKDKLKSLIDLECKLKRALADYDNLEKRIIAQKQSLVGEARMEILDKFTAVLDDLERAEEHLNNQGLTLAVSQFRQVLISEGVKEIEAKDKEFDPNLMDCVSMVKGSKNKVIKVAQKGYLLNDKVIRPAKVEVGSGKK